MNFNSFVTNAPFLYPLKKRFQCVEKGWIGSEWVDPNYTKQAQDVTFTLKIQNQSYPPLVFNNNYIKQSAYQKHQRTYFRFILNFKERFVDSVKEIRDNAFKTVNKTIY